MTEKDEPLLAPLNDIDELINIRKLNPLAPSTLYELLQDLFKKWTLKSSKYSAFAQDGMSRGNKLIPITKYSSYLQEEGGNIIITEPCHDRKNDVLEPVASLNYTLEKLKSVPDWTKAYIPVAQSNRYLFGLKRRKHYTLLELTKNGAGEVTVHHYDAKGFLSKLYSLANIKNAVRGVFGKNTSFQKIYKGDQKITDDVNCGRYVISYIKDLSSSNQIQSAPREFQHRFTEFQNILQNIGKSVKFNELAEIRFFNADEGNGQKNQKTNNKLKTKDLKVIPQSILKPSIPPVNQTHVQHYEKKNSNHNPSTKDIKQTKNIISTFR